MMWKYNILWYRDLRYWWFHKKLSIVAKFIRKHRIYPVNLNENLLNVWENKKNE